MTACSKPARSDNASFYTSGGDPGWAGFGLALAPLTIAQQVRSIRLLEIYNYGPWNNPQLGLYGFGQPDTSSSMILGPGVTSSIWGPTVAMLADAMGVTLERIEEAHRVIYAERISTLPRAASQRAPSRACRSRSRG